MNVFQFTIHLSMQMWTSAAGMLTNATRRLSASTQWAPTTAPARRAGWGTASSAATTTSA